MSRAYLGTGLQTVEDTIFTNRGNGRKWLSALSAAVEDDPARLIVFGDSVVELMYGAPVDRLRSRLAYLNGGRVGPGWVNGSPDSSLITGGVNILQPYKFRLTTGSYSASGGNLTEERGLGLYTFKLNSASVLTLSDVDNANATARFSRAEFHYTAHGTDADVGTAEIRIDGSLVQTVDGYDATLGAGVYESGHTYLWEGTEGDHTITITGAGSDPFWFDGVYLAVDGEKVWVYNGGNAGEKFEDFLTLPTGHAVAPPVEAAVSVDADAVILEYGINDYSDGVADYSADIATAVTALRTNVDDVSLGLLIPYATASRTDWDVFVSAGRAAAATAGVPIIDSSWMLETNASTTDPHDLISVDDVHQNAAGGEVWASVLAKFLTGNDVDWVAVVNALESRLLGAWLGSSYEVIGGVDTEREYPKSDRYATFWTPAFMAGLYVKSARSGSTLARMDLVHDNGAATTGTVAQFSIGANDENGLVASSGIPTALAYQRWVVGSGTLSSTNRGIDLFWANAAVNGTTVAERLRLLAGGGLQFSESVAAPSGAANKVTVYAHDPAGPTELRVMPPSGVPDVVGPVLRTYTSAEYVQIFDHYMGAVGPNTADGIFEGGTWCDLTGTGAQVQNEFFSYPSTDQHGVMGLHTGTSTTGSVFAWHIYNPCDFVAASSDLIFGARVRVPTLSDGTNTFSVYAGFQSLTLADGLYWRLLGSDTNWRAISRRASTDTNTDSTVARNASNWVNLSIHYSGATGDARFWLNGTLRATHTTNKPTDATQIYGSLIIAKSAGSTSRAFLADAMLTRVKHDTSIEQLLPA